LATLNEIVGFLSEPSTYGKPDFPVTVRETHMSFVFLHDDRVYKLKKPVTGPFMNFSTLAAREVNCREEVRLNRRLAPDTYLSVLPVTIGADGSLCLDGCGKAVEWLVEMRRLPDNLMLDRLLRTGAVTPGHMTRLVDRLADFYRTGARPAIDPRDHLRTLECQKDITRETLRHEGFNVDHRAIAHVLNDLDCAFYAAQNAIVQRIESGHYVEGHGDLRPEHICFCDPLVIFDCLEFNPRLRFIDPFDEVAFLAMECAFSGAAGAGETIRSLLQPALADQIPDSLWFFYVAFRATLRARMSYSHLIDGSAKETSVWEQKTDRYVSLAQAALYSGFSMGSKMAR